MGKVIRILFVEDSPDDVLLTARVLTKAGFELLYERVETAETMRAALAGGTWDVILADYNMPHFSAPDALTTLKEYGLDLPFIVVSGTIGEEKAVEVMRQGAHDYVMKQNLLRLPQAIEREMADAVMRSERKKMAQALFSSEKQLRAQVLQQKALLKINNAVQTMDRPSDLSHVAQACFEQISESGLTFQALIIRRLLDQTHGVFSMYAVGLNGSLDQEIDAVPHLLHIWNQGEPRYLPDIESDRGDLPEDTHLQMNSRYGLEMRSLLSVPFAGGVLSIMSDRSDSFSIEDIKFVQQVGEVLSVGVSRATDMEHLEAAVRHLPEGICLLDGTRRQVFGNPKGLEHLRDLAGVGVGEVVVQIGEFAFDDLLMEAGSMPCEMKTADRRVIEIEVCAIREEMIGGGWVMVFRDVTLARESQMQAHRQDRLAAVGQLAAGIAHDFNNMLTVVTGFAQMLEMREDMSEGSKADLMQIYEQGQRGAQLVRQILDFSRESDSGRQVVDLVPFLKETIKLLDRTLPESIEVSGNIPAEMVPVLGNLTQVQQVLTNLALNARDAMPEGGSLHFEVALVDVGVGSVPVIGMKVGQWVQLTVTDTGVGMPPDVLEHVYEPFFSTKERGEGTGLGLAQVYGIVKQHDGIIDVKSIVGEGTTFTIFLPLVDETVGVENLDLMIPEGQGQTILVAEDESEVLRSLKGMLEHLNYCVLSAGSGREAVEIFEANEGKIDALLLDLVMPDGGGLDVCDQLATRGVPMAIMTGYQAEAHRLNDRIQETAGLIEKPLHLQTVAQFLHKMLHPTGAN